MTSKDLLEGLFDVEREAEDVVEAARDEARKRIDAAKARARALVEEARVGARAAAIEREASARAEIGAEYAGRLESFGERLRSSAIDRESFDEACRVAIEELFPR